MAHGAKKVFRAHRVEEPEKDQSEVCWLISYSDFMMQLVCLFILLFSISSVETGQAEVFVQIWRAYLGLSPMPTVLPHQMTSFIQASEKKNEKQPKDKKLPQSSLEELRAAIALRLKMPAGESQYGTYVKILFTREGIRMQSLVGMFDEGSAQLNPLARDVLDIFAQIFYPYRDLVEAVEVTGYTAVNLEDSAEGSHMKMSLERARFAAGWLTRNDFPAAFGSKNVSFAGRGAYDPIGDNAHPEGRLQNRRVDVLVRLREKSEP